MRITICFLVVAAALGCARKDARAPASSASASGPAAAASNDGGGTSLVSDHPPTTAASHAPAAPADSGAAEAPVPLTGKVAETMDSGGYTYLQLETASGKQWAAIRQAPVKKGATVTVVGTMVMTDFESKTLHRKFDRIVFGSLEGGDGASAAKGAGAAPEAETKAAMNAMAAQHSAAAAGPAEVGDVKVPKAEGKDARTVAEIYAKKADLRDKDVVVRGKVVKALSGIMGKNWLHIRDGSGTAARKDDDLTITTKETGFAAGDVVVVRGKVHLDRDFGAGYAYSVIVEDASIQK